MIAFEALVDEYREHLALKYAPATVTLQINCARRAVPANGGVTAFMQIPVDAIQFDQGRTANYRGQVRRAAVDFRVWADRVHPCEGVTGPAPAGDLPVLSIEQIMTHERCGPDRAAGIRRHMIRALKTCGDETWVQTPDQIAERMYPFGGTNYQSANNKRSITRRAVRLLQANGQGSLDSSEVHA